MLLAEQVVMPGRPKAALGVLRLRVRFLVEGKQCTRTRSATHEIHCPPPLTTCQLSVISTRFGASAAEHLTLTAVRSDICCLKEAG